MCKSDDFIINECLTGKDIGASGYDQGKPEELRSRFEPGTSQIRNRNATRSVAIFDADK
jgi:hypothetical protein